MTPFTSPQVGYCGLAYGWEILAEVLCRPFCPPVSLLAVPLPLSAGVRGGQETTLRLSLPHGLTGNFQVDMLGVYAQIRQFWSEK